MKTGGFFEEKMANRQHHAAKMELKQRNRFAAGLVSERFPEVSDIVINMIYYRKGKNPVVMKRTINIVPAAYAYFKMDCMIDGCDSGGFDLSSVIDDMIRVRKKAKKGNLGCCGKIDSVATEHATIDYEIDIRYFK